MTLALSEIVIPTFSGGLGTLHNVLGRAAKHCEAQSLEPGVLLGARLKEDMFDFTEQVQAATDTARRVVERLAGGEPTSRPDPERSFEALLARVRETQGSMRSADRQAIDARQEERFTVNLGQEVPFTGRSYTLAFGLPNFLFHVSMAYGLMRQQGVALGKVEYLAPFIRG